MNKLARYLAAQFTIQSVSLFLVAALLVWITQALRLFDIITAKGQDIFTLIGQSALTTPRLGITIIFICMGIGLARTMRALQDSKELHTIYSTRRISALWSAFFGFVFGGIIITALLANWIEPWSNKSYSKWNEEIAADLVGRALKPNQFSEIVPGLIIVIGDRLPDGTIENFFVNDKRDEKTQRTYISRTAQIIFNENGYNISLIDGAMQFKREDGQFNEILFNRYALSLDKLTSKARAKDIVNESNSISLIIEGVRNGGISANVWPELNQRFSENLRILALCLFVASLSFYPHAKRGKSLFPIEVTVILVGMGERAINSMTFNSLPFGFYFSPLILIVFSIIVLAIKQFGYKIKFPQLKRIKI